MKLLELEVEGYRSLKHVIWKPGDLNVLIGPNGSGKTNLVKGLQLLTASARGNLKKFVLSEGGLEAMSWDKHTRDIHLRVATERRSANRDGVPRFFEYDLRLSWSFDLYEPLEKLIAAFEKDEAPENQQLVTILERTSDRWAILGKDFQLAPAEPDNTQVETLLSAARGPLGSNLDVVRFRMELERWQIYQAPETGADSQLRRPSVLRWEMQLDETGENAIPFIHTWCSEDRQFNESIYLAMRAAFAEDFEELIFAPASDARIQMRIRWRGLKHAIPATELSDGTLRFLFLISVLANPSPPPLIVIEEPELGLHPKMLPIIAEYAVDAARRTQVIFTTHSPDFLTAFRQHVPTVTVFNWENGETVLRTLKEDELAYWLKEYTLGEFAFSGAAEAVE